MTQREAANAIIGILFENEMRDSRIMLTSREEAALALARECLLLDDSAERANRQRRLFCHCLAAAAAAAFLFISSSCDAVAAGLDGVTNVVATLRADGSTNLWTAADLQDALGLLNRRYWRDMDTDAGRRGWHGEIIGAEVRTNAAGKVEMAWTYADGYVHAAEMPRRIASAADAVTLAERRANARAARLAEWRARLDAANAVIARGEGANGERREEYAHAVIDAAKYARAIERAELQEKKEAN